MFSICSAGPPKRRATSRTALSYYQRVFVVDIQFRDIADRMSEVERVAAMSGVVARTRTPATDALRDIQAPVRDAARATSSTRCSASSPTTCRSFAR